MADKFQKRGYICLFSQLKMIEHFYFCDSALSWKQNSNSLWNQGLLNKKVKTVSPKKLIGCPEFFQHYHIQMFSKDISPVSKRISLVSSSITPAPFSVPADIRFSETAILIKWFEFLGYNAIDVIVLQTITQEPSSWSSTIEWFVWVLSKLKETTTRGAKTSGGSQVGWMHGTYSFKTTPLPLRSALEDSFPASSL